MGEVVFVILFLAAMLVLNMAWRTLRNMIHR